MDVKLNPRPLETHVDWHREDVQDETAWTLELTQRDKRELDHALAVAKAHSDNLLDIGLEHFPLDALALKLKEVERELIDGRGFVRIRTLDTEKYSDDDLTMLYWGIGIHLGDPWPQNHYGHVMGDVTDQGKRLDDPTLRGNEIGGLALDYHTDGADIIGLMCLRKAKVGGLSCVANVVAIYNELVKTRPDLVAALYEPMPYDARGEQAKGAKPYYMFPVFTEHKDRLFVRFIPQYILASQKHAEAPRLSATAREALETVSAMARDPRYNVYMDLAPGEMQFIDNYHV
ncbi:MAG TPA: TauD/TfdA family dioxygenase, partial [Rhizomicrobium sp.]|nr:TauD/TfdA family dioxygenase [Rhizomicrobium sp.]